MREGKMNESTKNKINDQRGLVRILVGILVFCSIWGFFEATLGGFFNLVIFPSKGAIMSGIGMIIMGTALAIYRKPAMLPGIGVVAASFKLLNVWLLFVPIHAVHIINPAMAIVFESLAFSLVAVFLMKKMTDNALVGIGAGALAGLASATTYVYFAVYGTNSPIFERMGISSIGEFILGNGVIQAVFFALAVPLGLALGKKLAATTFPILQRQSLRYATSAAVIVACWGISALAIGAGL